MECAFVEIGLERNGFLYVDEIVVPELEGKRHGKKITDLIQRGQQILVQAVKDPMKTKGARLTTEISLPGRFLVYVPNGEGLGVSRRLEDAERQRLKDILKEIAPTTGGVIVRTAAEGASAEDIERDLVFLQRLWKTIQARAKSAKAPDLVYQEAELPLRIVRDLFAGDFVAAHVDNDRAHKRIVGYLKKTSPHMVERVHRTKDKEPLFERFGVEKEIASTLDRRVDLPSGGYLVFDYAEAFTVIDVNTGRFVGSRSKNSTQRLEDTIVKNNLEAVKEVVRQLRLRDIGGIIVIDFIDMANPKNRQAVEEALRTELERDRTKTYVVEISPLGLVEMTRQNVTDGPREVMTRKCPTCGGDGIVVSDATVALQVERKLRALAAAGAGSRVQAYKVALHPKTLSLLVGPGGARLAALEEATRRRFYLVPAEGHVHGDHFEVLAEGRRDDLAPAAPVEEGARARAEARRDRPPRRHGRGRQGRRRRRRRRRTRRSSSARRRPSRSAASSRAARSRRSSAASRPTPRSPSRARRRSRPAPRRGRRRTRRPETPKRPSDDAAEAGARRRATAEDDVEAEDAVARPTTDAEPRRGGRRRAHGPREAHAARLARRQAAEEARRGVPADAVARRRRERAGRRAGARARGRDEAHSPPSRPGAGSAAHPRARRSARRVAGRRRAELDGRRGRRRRRSARSTQPSRSAPPRRRRRRRRTPAEEAHAPRVARRAEPEAQAGGRRERRRRATDRQRGRDRGARRRGCRRPRRRTVDERRRRPSRSRRGLPAASAPARRAAGGRRRSSESAGHDPRATSRMSEWIEDFDAARHRP